MQRFTIEAGLREPGTLFFTIIAAELEPIGAPPLIALLHTHFFGMRPVSIERADILSGSSALWHMMW
ncbi:MULTISPECIES: hypothetical protein [Enterobacteriaceae]|uniref:hypothetical protein n=1 Tax=Enterobacteriaceae TaxID=543 RepID=UPI0012484249|nr:MULTISPECIES: hypothetical protein [Enterobacteriaceae]